MQWPIEYGESLPLNMCWLIDKVTVRAKRYYRRMERRTVINEATVLEKLRLSNGKLRRRESQELEFKEQFNWAGLPAYLRDFAAFANNRGGMIIFGVTDSPRRPVGLHKRSLAQFEKLDASRVTTHLNEHFSGVISWDYATIQKHSVSFGVFLIEEATVKPVIAMRDAGAESEIKEGEIYYRYGGQSRRIRYTELEQIIQQRIQEDSDRWAQLVSSIARTGPQNAAILDTTRDIIEKDDVQMLVVTKELASQLNFVKEGHFVDSGGAPTLQVIGNVRPVESMEVIRQQVTQLPLEEYPLTASDLAAEVLRQLPDQKTHNVWETIKEHGLKDNPHYSIYSFRNKRQQDLFIRDGTVPKGIPSIYRLQTVDFIVSKLRNNAS